MTEENKPEMEIKEDPVQGIDSIVREKKIQGIEDFDDWDFHEPTVADCISEKIPPKEILSSGSFWVNMSWLHIIALINRKSKSGKINTQITLKNFIKLYEKLMSKAFL